MFFLLIECVHLSDPEPFFLGCDLMNEKYICLLALLSFYTFFIGLPVPI